jgi:hypothetical protein
LFIKPKSCKFSEAEFCFRVQVKKKRRPTDRLSILFPSSLHEGGNRFQVPELSVLYFYNLDERQIPRKE